jgi:hypothetical protein
MLYNFIKCTIKHVFLKEIVFSKLKTQQKKPVTEVLIQNVPPESTSEFESQNVELDTNRQE